VDDTGAHPISSTDVNDYLRTAAQMDITAKEFRTWMGTLLAACELASLDVPESDREAKRAVTRTVGMVSRQLGNTPAVCRRSYVHPYVIDAFRSGTLVESWNAPARRVAGLALEERRLLTLLERTSSSSQEQSKSAKAA
jgi:DNA topoisomerase-1